jgi:hypothetical protein
MRNSPRSLAVTKKIRQSLIIDENDTFYTRVNKEANKIILQFKFINKNFPFTFPNLPLKRPRPAGKSQQLLEDHGRSRRHTKNLFGKPA